MRQPPSFVHSSNPSYVCKLKKAIYGLKQTPRAWYTELTRYLVSVGFQRSRSDTSLFIYQQSGCTVYLLIYVDDIIVTGHGTTIVDKFISRLAQRFSIKDLGTLHYFLGIEVAPSQGGLYLSQQKYVTDLLHEANMQDSKGVLTPMSSDTMLVAFSSDSIVDGTGYRKLVGKLQYLAFTRPDIAFL